MLRGVAICIDESSPSKKSKDEEDDDPLDGTDRRYWKYFPADKLPLQAEDRFQALFAIRDEWFSDDFEPYLVDLVKETGLTQAKILMQHTTNVPYTKHGKTGKLYRLKQSST